MLECAIDESQARWETHTGCIVGRASRGNARSCGLGDSSSGGTALAGVVGETASSSSRSGGQAGKSARWKLADQIGDALGVCDGGHDGSNGGE